MGRWSRTLIVDDDPWIRQSLADVLTRSAPELALSVAASVREALEVAARDRPEAAIVDLGLPDGSGLEVIAALRRTRPPCTSIAFTVLDDPPTIVAAMQVGARGYLLKNASTPSVIAALHEAVVDGGMSLSPAVAKLVVERLLDRESASDDEPLTPREVEILTLLARGATYAECATCLTIGLGTVQTYIKRIYAKLDVSSKAEAAVAAVRMGLVE